MTTVPKYFLWLILGSVSHAVNDPKLFLTLSDFPFSALNPLGTTVWAGVCLPSGHDGWIKPIFWNPPEFSSIFQSP